MIKRCSFCWLWTASNVLEPAWHWMRSSGGQPGLHSAQCLLKALLIADFIEIIQTLCEFERLILSHSPTWVRSTICRCICYLNLLCWLWAMWYGCEIEIAHVPRKLIACTLLSNAKVSIHLISKHGNKVTELSHYYYSLKVCWLHRLCYDCMHGGCLHLILHLTQEVS